MSHYFDTCPHCGHSFGLKSIHYLLPFDIDLDMCPFCGTSISKFSEYPEVILRQIVAREGSDILNQPRRLAAFLLDMISNKQLEKLSFVFATQHGLSIYFYKYTMVSLDKRNMYMEKARTLLEEQLGLNKERTKFILDSYRYAVDDISHLEIHNRKHNSYQDGDDIYYNYGEFFHKRAIETDTVDLGIYFLRLSDRAGNPKALHRLFEFYDDADQYDSIYEAFSVRKEIAQKEHDPKATYRTALHYSYGVGTEMDLPSSAYYWQLGRFYTEESKCEFYLRQLAGFLPMKNVKKTLAMLRNLSESFPLAKLLYEEYNRSKNINRMALIFAQHCTPLNESLSLSIVETEYIDSYLFWLGLPYRSGDEALAFEALMFLYNSKDEHKQLLGISFLNEFLETVQNPEIKKKTASILVSEFKTPTRVMKDKNRLKYLQSLC